MVRRPVPLLVSLAFATDRKSTRLNSSHLVISYAVFCLKKKKINSLKTLHRHLVRWSPKRQTNAGRSALAGRLIRHDSVFFFNDTATTEIYTLSLHDALPI